MTDEQKTVYMLAQIALFNARIAGMVAENAHRTQCGLSLAYAEEHFIQAIEESGIHHNAIVGVFQS